MYYKICKKVLFRKYEKYGYLTDNSMFEYRRIDDYSSRPGEEYVSESGAIMLEVLTKEPKHIDNIVYELLEVFQDVEFDELKQDVIEFFTELVNEHFLCSGATFEECNVADVDFIDDIEQKKDLNIVREDCSKGTIDSNDLLKSLHIELVSECNERCLHCYIPHEQKNKVINRELFYQIVEQGRKLNIINVTLSGGEPLLHKDFLDFIEKCRELDLSVNVLTNLTLLSDEMITVMKRNPLLCVQTSLYAMDANIHDQITQKKGSFEKTKDNILKLCSAGIPVQIACPVMKQNLQYYNGVIEWGQKNNIYVGTDFVIFAAYDHLNRNLVNRLSFDDVEKIYDSEITKERAKDLLSHACEKRKKTKEDNVCTVCRYYVCVTADGKVFPCVGWQTRIIGDLNNESLENIWKHSNEIKKLRNVKLERFEKCIECEDRGFCTICMMNNSNENQDEFKVTEFHCNVAKMIHGKVDQVLGIENSLWKK